MILPTMLLPGSSGAIFAKNIALFEKRFLQENNQDTSNELADGNDDMVYRSMLGILNFAAKNMAWDFMEQFLQIDYVKQNIAKYDNNALKLLLEINEQSALVLLQNEEVVKKLDYETLSQAVEANHPLLVKQLLQQDALKQIACAEQNYLFRIAVEYGYGEILEELLKIDSVRAMAGINNNQALYQALAKKNHEIVTQLLKLPAVRDVYIQNEQGLYEFLMSCPQYLPVVCEHWELYGIKFRDIINSGEMEEALVAINLYIHSPEQYLKEIQFPASKIQAARLLKAYYDVEQYEAELKKKNQFGQLENMDDKEKISVVMNCFNSNIKPAFFERFMKNSETQFEALEKTEIEIRSLILKEIKENAIEKIKLLSNDKDKNQNLIKEEQALIAFIEHNGDRLILGKDEDLMAQARKYINSTQEDAQIAWRAYDKWAPCLAWPNLLTPPLVNRMVEFSLKEIHDGQVDTKTASEIAREMVAYSYWVVMDEAGDGDKNNRIKVFISQLADIRRANNTADQQIDNPSCLPGTVNRAGNMWSMHPLGIKKEPTELIPEIIKPKVLALFNDAMSSNLVDKEKLYSALVMLRFENAKDILTAKMNDEKYLDQSGVVRQAFTESLPSLDEMFYFVNQTLGEMKHLLLKKEEKVYLAKYLADIGGGWIAEALTDRYRKETPPEETPCILRNKVVNPFILPLFMQNKSELMAGARPREIAWERIFDFLKSLHLRSTDEELGLIAKEMAQEWVKSENMKSPEFQVSEDLQKFPTFIIDSIAEFYKHSQNQHSTVLTKRMERPLTLSGDGMPPIKNIKFN